MLEKVKKYLKPNLIYFFINVFIVAMAIAGFSLAKFESSAKTSNNIATVAAFVVDASGNGSDTFEVNCNLDNPTAVYDVTVTNKKNNIISQVGITYNIIVTFSSILPRNMQLSISTSTGEIVQNGGKTSYTFKNVGILSSGIETTNTHTVTLTGNSNVGQEFIGFMEIYVDAFQID